MSLLYAVATPYAGASVHRIDSAPFTTRDVPAFCGFEPKHGWNNATPDVAFIGYRGQPNYCTRCARKDAAQPARLTA